MLERHKPLRQICLCMLKEITGSYIKKCLEKWILRKVYGHKSEYFTIHIEKRTPETPHCDSAAMVRGVAGLCSINP